MKMERRFTSVHQTITFSRRMMLLGCGQAAIGAVLLGRLGLALSQRRTRSINCCPRAIASS